MKRKLLAFVIILFIIIATVVIHQYYNTVRVKLFDCVKTNYSNLTKAEERLLEYEPEDRFYLADPDDVKTNNQLVQGHLYVEHNTDRDLGYFNPEALNDEDVQKALALDGVTEIYREKDVLTFDCDDLADPDGNDFYGFYYSVDGEPRGVSFFEGQTLKKDGKGWCCIFDEESSKYYTEKIKNNWYYYEGVFYP